MAVQGLSSSVDPFQAYSGSIEIMIHPQKKIHPQQTIVREYDKNDKSWGHIGRKSWNRVNHSDRNTVVNMRRANTSFVIFVYYPSVCIVKKYEPGDCEMCGQKCLKHDRFCRACCAFA